MGVFLICPPLGNWWEYVSRHPQKDVRRTTEYLTVISNVFTCHDRKCFVRGFTQGEGGSIGVGKEESVAYTKCPLPQGVG